MSHRTENLPELRGPARIVRELRYHEASRQLLAFVRAHGILDIFLDTGLQ